MNNHCPYCSVKRFEDVNTEAPEIGMKITKLDHGDSVTILLHPVNEKADPRTHFLAWYTKAQLEHCTCAALERAEHAKATRRERRKQRKFRSEEERRQYEESKPKKRKR